MGADRFFTEHEGTDVDVAFNAAREQALRQEGHGGYTGTIAEKDAVTVISATPMPADDAHALAERLLANKDARVDDKAGPCGAIAVSGGVRTVQITIPPTDRGWPTPREAIECVLSLGEGLSIDGHPTGVFEHDERTHRIVSGTAGVRIRGGDQHTGWLFFGWSPA